MKYADLVIAGLLALAGLILMMREAIQPEYWGRFLGNF
jgi:hypothetical protein